MNASVVGCLIYGFILFLCTILTVWAQSEWRVPDPPENVKAKADSKSITLWWNPPSSSNQILVRGYTISFGIETPSRRLIIEEPNKTYIFAITAYNEAQGEDSEKVLLSASTTPFPNDQNAAKSPIGLKADVLSPSEVRVYWTDLNVDTSRTDPSVKQRFYNVEYWNTALSTSERKKLTTETPKASLNQLEPNQLYGYRVRVMIRGGSESQWSETHYFRTPDQVDEREGLVEKCDFETPGQCDYVSDTNGLYDWTRVRTENGSSDSNASSFGLLKSPFFNLRKSAAICIQLHYIVFPGSKGTFKLSLLFEGNELDQAVPLFYAQLRDLPQGVWQKLTAEAKAKPNRGFQLLLEGTRTKNKNTGFKINVDNVTVIANVCPEVQRHFGNVVVFSR
ncbi:MAM domain-containing glycosylphosphatidylinositol anchor protein 1 [Aphelenchoides besseyi]|nr:MAM domain-containing glycosylphosphatidylinositol anchor protein 1 [Aphelenchoides besseyi]